MSNPTSPQRELSKFEEIMELVEQALDLAHSQGMEFVAECEGCSWGNKDSVTLEGELLDVQEKLEAKLRELTGEPE
jgi:hypothetical protein